MRLVVSIPERWEDANDPVTWALVGSDGMPAGEGEGVVSELPKAQRTVLVLPATRVLLTSAALPRRGTRRVRAALAYAVEDQLTCDPESVHAVAAGASRNARQPVAVVDRAWLSGVVAAFESAGAAPHSVTVETCLVPRAHGEWTVVLQDRGGFLRTDEALGLAFDHAEWGAIPDALRLSLDAAGSSGAAPKKIVLHADATVDVDGWSRELGVPCEAAGPWRAWQSSERPAIEFLQGEFDRRSGPRRLWPRLRPAAFLVTAAIAVEVVGTIVQWGALRYEKAQLEARMHEQFKAAFPQAQAIVDPALQMQRNLAAARAAAGVAQEGDFLPLLAKATRADPGAGWKVKTVGYDAGRLTLDVQLADRSEADSMLKRFDQGIVGVALEAASPKAAGGEARFVFMPRSER